ncbi:glycerophosphoryl diester phosphodiesterase [Evansella vedderi]|uniref:Glycerophosphoryl diester phosphodiesterase n=1 Tax=Evansella vedderi TaxID=38282 RepID=A0ABT9ZT05_9BACI|nr:glycerophosphodiester phosphodiesterase family protein [Evansella vedderi]MDQ0254372.1 glycerophosphoryl diester phosphodiesterase [Evansella vedderi]
MKIIAHRGNKRYTPENTMAAFQSACQYPIDGIEFDLQITKDGIPIVIHDEKIDRTTNGKGFVRTFTFREIRKFDAGSWFNKSFQGEKIPSFEEVILWSKGKNITLHIELKHQKGRNNQFLHTFLEMVEDYKMIESVVISSFNHSYITYLKELNSSLSTAFITKTPIFGAIKYASKIKADAIHIRNSYQAMRFYRTWMSKGLPVRAYNVHRIKDAMKCHRLNIDSIITNDPKKMTEIFRHLCKEN